MSDTDPESDPPSSPESSRGTTDDRPFADSPEEVVRYLYWGALAVLALFALVAAVQFYASASRAITVWVAREYRPLFQAAFNLVVLLVAGVGVSLLAGRLTDTPEG